jgi:DNA modification methylase
MKECNILNPTLYTYRCILVKSKKDEKEQKIHSRKHQFVFFSSQLKFAEKLSSKSSYRIVEMIKTTQGSWWLIFAFMQRKNAKFHWNLQPRSSNWRNHPWKHSHQQNRQNCLSISEFSVIVLPFSFALIHFFSVYSKFRWHSKVLIQKNFKVILF